MSLLKLRELLVSTLQILDVIFPQHGALGPVLCKCGRRAEGILRDCCGYAICRVCLEQGIKIDECGQKFVCPYCTHEHRPHHH